MQYISKASNVCSKKINPAPHTIHFLSLAESSSSPDTLQLLNIERQVRANSADKDQTA